MNAVVGTAAVALGLAGAVLGVVTLGLGLARRDTRLLRTGQRYVWVVLGGAVVATVAMQAALIGHDFSLDYVARNGSRDTPLLYTITGMWSALEGSILLWGLVLAGYLAVMARHFRSRATDPLVAWATLTGLVVAAFFFMLMAGPANPFQVVSGAVPLDGTGPNPLLQNHPLVAFHPPMLYLGYVGFTIPFAFAIAALVTGRLGEGWLVETRRWTLFAWGFLTAGIILGRMVVVRGPRVGRLLGLGPGGERVVPALAHRHRLPALGDGPGAAGDAAGLEPVPPDRHLLADDPGHVPHPVGRARLGARLLRVGHRAHDPRASSPSPWPCRSDWSPGGATSCGRRVRSTRRCPGTAPSWPTTWPSPPSPSSCSWAPSSP